MDVEVFSFFSGLGFLDLGFENAGFNIVFVNEYNEQFLKAYQYARRYNGHIPAYGYSHKDVREFWISMVQLKREGLLSCDKNEDYSEALSGNFMAMIATMPKEIMDRCEIYTDLPKDVKKEYDNAWIQIKSSN